MSAALLFAFLGFLFETLLGFERPMLGCLLFALFSFSLMLLGDCLLCLGRAAPLLKGLGCLTFPTFGIARIGWLVLTLQYDWGAEVQSHPPFEYEVKNFLV